MAVSVTKRRFHPFINSAWRSLSSLFIFYGMVATRGPVIYTRGMVDDTNKSESPVMYDVFFTVASGISLLCLRRSSLSILIRHVKFSNFTPLFYP